MNAKNFFPFKYIVILLAVGVLQGPLFGQSKSNVPDPGSKQSTRTDSQGRNITVVDFDDARIEGTAKAPDGFFLRSRNSAQSDNILTLRKNFHRRVRSVGHEGLRAVPMN